MPFLLALLLAQSFPSSITARQGRSLDGGLRGWAVECTNCPSGGTTNVSVAGGGTVDGGDVTVHGALLVFVADAGPPLNVNFPATQAVSIASMPSTPVTGSFWQAIQNVNIVDAGPALNVNFPATQAVSAASLPLPSGAATGTKQDTGNTSLSSIDGKLPALAGGKIPVDIGASIVSVTGGLTDTQLRASAVPVSLASAPTTAVTGTFWQSTQPVSLASAPTTPITAAALPLPSGAATDATLSGLLDGGVQLLSTIAANQTSGQRTQVTFIAQPLNPFLPRCNPVRRTGCQP